MEEPPLRVYPPNRTPVSPMGTPSYSSSSSSSNNPLLPLPKPNEALQEMGTPQFLLKTFEMVEDPTTDPVVSWSRARNSFVVWDYCRLAADVLPKYFKHNNFCSFVRQLNTYGFRKVDPDRWEFASQGFLGGQKHLLKTIRRRRNPPKSLQRGRNDNFSFSIPSNSGLKIEIESLKTDKAALTLEAAILRQHQQASAQEMLSIEKRLKGTEKNQHLMLAFLAKLVKNRSFAEKLIMCNEQKKSITGGGADPKGRPGEGHGVFPKKRRLPCGESVEALKAETEIDTLLFRTPIQDGIEVDDAEGVLSREMIMPREEVTSEVVEGLVASNAGDDSFVQDLVKQMGYLGSKQ